MSQLKNWYNESMVIGFDGSRVFASWRTGTENYSYQLLKSLSKIDKINKYIVYIRPNANNRDTAVQQTLQFSANFEFKTINWLRLWTQVGLASKTFTDRLDVLFVPSHTLPIFRRPGLKTVMTVHDLGAEYLPKMHQLKQQLYLKYITKYQLRSATKLIAVSKATKMDLIKKGIESKKIRVVYEGYDAEVYGLIPYLLAKQEIKVLPKAGSYFLFVGTVQPRKNLERLINAFAIVARGPAGSASRRASSLETLRLRAGNPSSPSPLATQNLVIVGSKGWLSDEIYKLPKKLGIEKRVKFLGYVPDKDMVGLYTNAIALVFPSLFEGFGLPILEAQACSCPVLTSNISSMPEVAGKGAILVDPYSARDIASGMIKIMDKKVRINLIKKGFENVKKFSWEKCARETLRVLEEAVSG